MAKKETKANQTIYERAEIAEQVVFRAQKLLANIPIEVIGHLESLALCCRNGTVAIVKLDLDKIVNPNPET